MAIFNILLLVLCTVSLSFAKPPTNQPINQSPQSITKHDSIDQSINQSINQSPYVEWADQAFKIFMSSLYNSQTQMLRASVNSADPSQYWNTAVAFQSLLHYHNLKASINQPTDQPINHDQSIDQPSLLKGEGSIDQSINDDQSLNDENVVIPLIYQLIDSQTTLGVKLGQCDAQLRNNYNDDMSWMIHGLTALYDVTGNKSLINRSIDLHMFIRLSEDTTCCGDMKGGIWWDRTHTQKATAAQAGAALTGLRLMESKADKFSREEWIDWSIAHYDFWLNHMVNQTNYAVCDNINTDGDRRWWSFTYNEGLMLGVAVHLYRATNDSRFLSDADRLIGRLIDTSINVSINGRKGRVLASDGENCSGDTCQFKQVAFQYSTEYYRLLLDLTNPSINQPINQSINQSKFRVKANELYQFLQDNIDSLTTNAYNATTMTFNCDWSRQFDPSIKGSINGLQGTMNGALSSISLFAGLPTPPKLNKLEQMLMKTLID